MLTYSEESMLKRLISQVVEQWFFAHELAMAFVHVCERPLVMYMARRKYAMTYGRTFNYKALDFGHNARLYCIFRLPKPRLKCLTKDRRLIEACA